MQNDGFAFQAIGHMQAIADEFDTGLPLVFAGGCPVLFYPGGLGIKASEFDIVAQHLVDTLNKFNVPEKEHKELMDIIGTLRPDIVEVEGK